MDSRWESFQRNKWQICSTFEIKLYFLSPQVSKSVICYHNFWGVLAWKCDLSQQPLASECRRVKVGCCVSRGSKCVTGTKAVSSSPFSSVDSSRSRVRRESRRRSRGQRNLAGWLDGWVELRKIERNFGIPTKHRGSKSMGSLPGGWWKVGREKCSKNGLWSSMYVCRRRLCDSQLYFPRHLRVPFIFYFHHHF